MELKDINKEELEQKLEDAKYREKLSNIAYAVSVFNAFVPILPAATFYAAHLAFYLTGAIPEFNDPHVMSNYDCCLFFPTMAAVLISTFVLPMYFDDKAMECRLEQADIKKELKKRKRADERQKYFNKHCRVETLTFEEFVNRIVDSEKKP